MTNDPASSNVRSDGLRSDESERGLMIRAQGGDPAAMMALLNRYIGPLYTLVFRAVGDRGTAQDVARDCLAARLRSLAKQVPSPQTRWPIELAADAWRALREAGCVAHLRAGRLRIPARLWSPETLHLAETEARHRHTGQRLRRLLARAWSKLTMKQRFVLALTESQPVSLAELAHVLGQSESEARAARNEAKLTLMALLENPDRELPGEPTAGAKATGAAARKLFDKLRTGKLRPYNKRGDAEGNRS